MLAMIVVTAIVFISGAMRLLPNASASRAKPNSPPWLKLNPARNELAGSLCSNVPIIVIMSVFKTMRQTVNRITQYQLLSKATRSNCIPTETKNKPNNTSRNGRMSASS